MVLLILTCTKPQEEANINDQTNKQICYTGETEIFKKILSMKILEYPLNILVIGNFISTKKITLKY